MYVNLVPNPLLLEDTTITYSNPKDTNTNEVPILRDKYINLKHGMLNS